MQIQSQLYAASASASALTSKAIAIKFGVLSLRYYINDTKKMLNVNNASVGMKLPTTANDNRQSSRAQSRPVGL